MVSENRSAVVAWSHSHVDTALRICYAAAAVVFVACLVLLRHPVLLGVLVGFALVRGVLLAPEWLAESVQIRSIRSGDYREALRRPGMSAGRQVLLLKQLVTDTQDRLLAEKAASFLGYCIDSGFEQAAPVAHAFEDTWGKPPCPGADESLIRVLLDRGIRFTITDNSSPEPETPIPVGVSWSDLWRRKLWGRLREEHPGEPLPRLLLRLYAAEWQSVLSPIWVLAAVATLVILSQHWLSANGRGLLAYVMLIILGSSAIWLAFILRPGAFNASLLVGDMDRCAQWVLDSTEGKHFLVAALGSTRAELRRQAARLLLWHDTLLSAAITLPEGMLAFARREGSRREKKRRARVAL